MSFITKYRPADFKNVVGQSAVVKSLKGVLAKKASRTFLFHGPSGTGKTTLARITAKVMGCGAKDIQEIDAATFTGIDDMRTLTSTLMYRPIGDTSMKAIIIDECHALTSQAWKSILKATEEPPPWVVWFLCTTELGKVPPTIKTRTTAYELKPVSRDDLFELLDRVAAAEKLPADEGVLELCAKMAQGSPRQALANLAACAEAQDRKAAAELLASVQEGGSAFELAQALAKRAPWTTIQRILGELGDQNAESVRHVIRAYFTKVVLGAKTDKAAISALAVLDEFGQPFPYGDGISPLVLACGRICLGD